MNGKHRAPETDTPDEVFVVTFQVDKHSPLRAVGPFTDEREAGLMFARLADRDAWNLRLLPVEPFDVETLDL
jgi:alpha-D-ribose 1-methylphosphonate 5-phosphate C-P lyase